MTAHLTNPGSKAVPARTPSVWRAMAVLATGYVVLIPVVRLIARPLDPDPLPFRSAQEWMPYLLMLAALGVIAGAVWYGALRLRKGWRRTWLELFVGFVGFSALLMPTLEGRASLPREALATLVSAGLLASLFTPVLRGILRLVGATSGAA